MPFGSMARNESTSVSATGFAPVAAAAGADAAPCAIASPMELANEKLTTSAPEPLRTLRRDGVKWLFMAVSPSGVGGCALDRLDDAVMGAAAAEVVGERVLDLRFGRLLGLGEERRGFHDHAVDAIAALRRLLLDEGALHRMRLLRRAEPFQGHHLLAGFELR